MQISDRNLVNGNRKDIEMNDKLSKHNVAAHDATTDETRKESKDFLVHQNRRRSTTRIPHVGPQLSQGTLLSPLSNGKKKKGPF